MGAMKLKEKKRQLVSLNFGKFGETSAGKPRDISCVAQSGQNVWVGSDETTWVERLTWDPESKEFGAHAHFDLAKLFQLPGGRKQEIDLEGMTVAGRFLWITGSHSLTRGKPAGRDFEHAIAELTQVERETNRYFLARVPLLESKKTPGEFELVGNTESKSASKTVGACRLFGTGKTNVLTDALRFDDLLRPYVDLPSKDNGLDVEGIAVDEDRVFLGLRGPVLRGWAVMIELEPEYFCSEYFTLRNIGKGGRLYRRHFFDLRGLGIRDLQLHGGDLLILAGPTMAIDGRVLLLRWKDFHRRRKECVIPRDELDIVLDFGAGDMSMRGQNHPEGITIFNPPDGCELPPGLLVTYDSPAGEFVGKHGRVSAELFPMKR
jgi:hypothetical protein